MCLREDKEPIDGGGDQAPETENDIKLCNILYIIYIIPPAKNTSTSGGTTTSRDFQHPKLELQVARVALVGSTLRNEKKIIFFWGGGYTMV